MLKRISVADVRIGMYIQAFCGRWVDHPFWKKSFLLQTDKDLQRIYVSKVEELLIDISKGLDCAGEPAPSATAQLESTGAAVPASASSVVEQLPSDAAHLAPADFSLEMRRAALICERSKQAVIAMFDDVRMGRALQTDQADGLIEEITASVIRHPGAMISLARLKHADEYTYMHSVAVCALMIALARQLGLGMDQVREAGLAGLLHDVGKMTVCQELLNKPGKLTEAEFEAVRQHPELGGKILLENKQTGALVLDVCMHHHEKYDGSGYPHGLAGEQISVLARMGAICDVYDAITSNRAYKAGWDPATAISRMASWTGHFDQTLLHAFVKTVGIYPIGSLVRLQSGRLGVVTEQNSDSLLMPKVKVFYSIDTHMPIIQQTIDLSETPVRDKILNRETPDNWGFSNLEQLWLETPSKPTGC